MPLIRDPGSWEEKPVFAEIMEDPSAEKTGETLGVAMTMISGPWKLIVNFKSPTNMKKPRYELYNLHDDPRERSNVAEKHEELVQKYEKQVMRWSTSNLKKRPGFDEKLPIDIDPRVLERLRELGYIR